jgi:hypothetical protein
MANEISLVTASGRTVTPKDDGIIYEVFSPGNGIIYGGAVTIKDSSTLHITAGHGIVCGRKFTIDDSDIPVALSGSGSLLGRLYIHLDLADAADPITLLVETGASLTPVVQDDDVNINNGVYEINIATFDVDTSTISNLVNLDVTVAPMGDMVGATAGEDGKGGYVPAPQAGDEDKVLKGDGTWGSAGDTATARYNETTDHFEVLYNGSWAQSIKAWVQSVPVWVNGQFGISIKNGIYKRGTAYQVKPYTINGTTLNASYESYDFDASLVSDETIDITNYGEIKVKFRESGSSTQQTITCNISQITGNYYLYIDYYGYGGATSLFISVGVSTTQNNFANPYVAQQLQQLGSQKNIIIEEITIE